MADKRKKDKKGGKKIKLDFLIPVCVEQLSKEDPALLRKMPVLNQAVKRYKKSKEQNR